MSIINFDKETREVRISLPDKCSHLARFLQDDLEAEFAFEPLGEKTALVMDRYARQWLDNHGFPLEEKS